MGNEHVCDVAHSMCQLWCCTTVAKHSTTARQLAPQLNDVLQPHPCFIPVKYPNLTPHQNPTETPEVDDEDNGGGYDDEGFEDYSDEFDGEDEGPSPAGATKTIAAAAADATRPRSSRKGAATARGGGGVEVAMVSPAFKMKEAGMNDDVQAPHGKVWRRVKMRRASVQPICTRALTCQQSLAGCHGPMR